MPDRRSFDDQWNPRHRRRGCCAIAGLNRGLLVFFAECPWCWDRWDVHFMPKKWCHVWYQARPKEPPRTWNFRWGKLWKSANPADSIWKRHTLRRIWVSFLCWIEFDAKNSNGLFFRRCTLRTLLFLQRSTNSQRQDKIQAVERRHFNLILFQKAGAKDLHLIPSGYVKIAIIDGP